MKLLFHFTNDLNLKNWLNSYYLFINFNKFKTNIESIIIKQSFLLCIFFMFIILKIFFYGI